MTRYVCARFRNVNLCRATWCAFLQEWHVRSADVALNSNMIRLYKFTGPGGTEPSLVRF